MIPEHKLLLQQPTDHDQHNSSESKPPVLLLVDEVCLCLLGSKGKKPSKQSGAIRGEYSSKKLKKECILSELKITRQKFKDFQTITASITHMENEIKLHYDRLHDDILFRKIEFQELSNITDQFERIFHKAQSNFRTSKKNWNEEETIFLISVVTYWTFIKKEDHKKIVNKRDLFDYLSLFSLLAFPIMTGL